MPIYIANIISQLLDQNSQTRTVACIMPAHKKKKKKKPTIKIHFTTSVQAH